MAEEICAVVVTYNRENLLIENVKALLNQTINLKWIVIVDNASNDYNNFTKMFFSRTIESNVCKTVQQKYQQDLDTILHGKYNEVDLLYVRLKKNKGGAGGFNIGISIGLETMCDWFWLLDDDIEPLKNCLEVLYKYRDISECIHPRRIFKDNSEYLWEGGIDIVTGLRYSMDDISFKNGKNFCMVNVGCFEGMLISRKLINKIGLPDERFFIVDDDTIYGFMASLYTNVLYVKNAIIIKKIKKPNYELEPTFIYYYLRNYKLKIQYLNKYFPKYRVVRFIFYLLSIIKFSIRCLRAKRLVLLKYILKALVDSARNRFGKGL